MGRETRRFNGKRICGLIRLLGFLNAVLCFAGFAPEGYGSQNVTLAWDPNSESDVGGYKIYCGPSSRNYTNIIDVGNVTSNRISNLASGSYYFAVTAYNTLGLESDYSNEVPYTVSESSSSIGFDPGSIAWQTNGQFSVMLNGAPQKAIVVETSTDFINWTSVTTNVFSGSTFT